MSRLAYFARETLISLRRNLLMTIAGIITVAISLFLFGGILLVSATVDHGTQQWKHGIELEIFMKVGSAKKQVQVIEKELKADPQVKSYKYLNQQDAYNIFKKDFADQPALVESTKPSDLPESFRVEPQRAELTAPLALRYEGQQNVATVITAAQQIKRLLTATRWIRLAFISMASVLLASSLFLIVNTIRLATFARRREIEVMKLVGASNWFVRVPFMAEGLVQGAIGAGFAFGLVWALKIIIANLLSNQHSLLSTFRVTSADALGIGILVLAIGAAIGVIGSIVGLRRFLDA
ncbi:MAG: ABC transporter permease [Actinomycetota bacterium]|nr:ABC transporter permease [Actinomycetota bacterium]